MARARKSRAKEKVKLSKAMTVSDFDNGYWYTTDLQTFAVELRIPSAKQLRKDELEAAIKSFLRTGTVAQAPKRLATSPSRRSAAVERDVDLGLSLTRRVIHYTNDPETKDFIERESRKLAPGMKRRSGARYRLNRWREEQLAKGIAITYRDLVRHYVLLSTQDAPFAKIPHGRYINFVAEYLASEKGATRAAAIAAWKELKKLDLPKTYRAWRQHLAKRRAR